MQGTAATATHHEKGPQRGRKPTKAAETRSGRAGPKPAPGAILERIEDLLRALLIEAKTPINISYFNEAVEGLVSMSHFIFSVYRLPKPLDITVQVGEATQRFSVPPPSREEAIKTANIHLIHYLNKEFLPKASSLFGGAKVTLGFFNPATDREESFSSPLPVHLVSDPSLGGPSSSSPAAAGGAGQEIEMEDLIEVQKFKEKEFQAAYQKGLEENETVIKNLRAIIEQAKDVLISHSAALELLLAEEYGQGNKTEKKPHSRSKKKEGEEGPTDPSIQMLDKVVKALPDQMTKLGIILNILKEKLSETEKEKKKQAQERTQKALENEKLQTKIKTLEEKIATTETRITQQQKENERLQERCSSQETRAQTETHIQTLERTIDELRRQLQASEGERAKLHSKENTTRATIEQLQREKQSFIGFQERERELRAEVIGLRNELEHASTAVSNTAIVELISQFREMNAQREAERRARAEEVQALQGRIADLSHQVEEKTTLLLEQFQYLQSVQPQISSTAAAPPGIQGAFYYVPAPLPSFTVPIGMPFPPGGVSGPQ